MTKVTSFEGTCLLRRFEGTYELEKQFLDTTGFGRLDLVTTIEIKAEVMRPGDVLEVVGDCPDFKEVVLDWCQQIGKVWLAIKEEVGSRKTIRIQF